MKLPGLLTKKQARYDSVTNKRATMSKLIEDTRNLNVL